MNLRPTLSHARTRRNHPTRESTSNARTISSDANNSFRLSAARTRVLAFIAAVAASAAAAPLVSDGEDSPDNVAANATVNIRGNQSGSGTLITSRLVVTNGHVASVPLPSMSPRFSRGNEHDPALWYPIPPANRINVFIGAPHGRAAMSRRDPFTSPRTRLQIDDRNRGPLMSGDEIGLKARGHYLFVEGGRRGGELMLDDLHDRWGAWQSLTIHKLGGTEGSEIRGGDRIALRAADGSYLAATQTEGFVVADSPSRQGRHEFAILTFEGRGPLSNDPIRHGGHVAIMSTNPAVGYIMAPYVVAGARITTPGFDDIALIELVEAVPDVVARPVPIKLRLSAGEAPNLDAYYNGTRLTFAGYGRVAGGADTRWRQQANATNARRETPDPTGRNAELSTRYTGNSRSRTQLGDSGGSWFAETPQDRRLVGITQQTGNNFLTPMYRGGVDSEGQSKPDVHAWFSMLLQDDDCVPMWTESGLRQQRGREVGAPTVCRFGSAGAPFAVTYPGATRRLRGEDCVRFDPGTISMRRPATPEGTGSDAWTLVDGPRQMMRIEGSWQQSYNRGTYLISYLRRNSMTQMCFSNRPNPQLVYFRS